MNVVNLEDRYPALPVTPEFRAKLKQATSRHGSKKELAMAIGFTGSAITVLLRPTTLTSRMVQPICEYYGWPLPVVTIRDERDERWLLLGQQLTDEEWQKVFEMAQLLVEKSSD